MTEYSINKKVWLHIVLQTNSRLPLILPEMEKDVYNTLRECCKNTGLLVGEVGGTADHIHLLVLDEDKSSVSFNVKSFAQESAVIINERYFKAGSFAWHSQVYVFSVSHSQAQKVGEYIANQKEIHKTKNSKKEIEEFAALHQLNG
jgi:REP element-mobilizing transposase RayT